MSTPETIKLTDYTPVNYRAEKTHLIFDLFEEHGIVTATVDYHLNDGKSAQLNLVGLDLELLDVKLDGKDLDLKLVDYSPKHLTLQDLPKAFQLTVTTKIYPQKNTALEGLYKSNGKFSTQCEPEGFRRITYYQDRPDVMSEYTTTIIADKARYPVLLSNGNPVAYQELEGGRHKRVWHDPFPKPSYLFALVAGKLDYIEDTYTSCSGRKIKLQIYVEEENIDKCDFAMKAVKDSMKWDEDVYGLEYDLDIFMIVAVSDFNMGAMENKGLNIFNSKYILANPKTATDSDFEGIQSVVGHEYFHNWTGNRVTCRDWFQLSLKEGLTVFRDQEFSADLNNRGVNRIADVQALRNSQFVEDSGPMAHPVRPDSYIEINNFYTATVYNKGAEVIRMIHTILGRDLYHEGIKLYFKRHDGQAVTVEDFVAAMEDASGISLQQFTRWYHQSGTPVVEASLKYHKGETILKLKQILAPTPGQSHKEPHLIPLKTAFFGKDGRAIPFTYQGTQKDEHVLLLDQLEQEFIFDDFKEETIPSIGRSFSAPIKLKTNDTHEGLQFLMKWDTDTFNRNEAAQKLTMSLIKRRQQEADFEIPGDILSAYRSLISMKDLDPRLKASALALPSTDYLVSLEEQADIENIFNSRQWFQQTLATACLDQFKEAYQETLKQGAYSRTPLDVGLRAFKNLCLSYIIAADKTFGVSQAEDLFKVSDNMTDTMTALETLSHYPVEARKLVLDAFYQEWKGDQLVIDKWFAIQAGSDHVDVLVHVKALLEHQDFDILNPNRIYASLRRFGRANPYGFHNNSGEGYRLMADYVLKIDGTNPQIAAILAKSLSQWRRFDKTRQEHMIRELNRIMAASNLSNDVYEVVSKSLED